MSSTYWVDAMAPNERIEALTRHLTSAIDIHDGRNQAAVPDFCPVQLNKFLIRDNYELRRKILDFLKVGPRKRLLDGFAEWL